MNTEHIGLIHNNCYPIRSRFSNDLRKLYLLCQRNTLKLRCVYSKCYYLIVRTNMLVISVHTQNKSERPTKNKYVLQIAKFYQR